MPTSSLRRPQSGEYSPYFNRYLEALPTEGDVLALLERQLDETTALLGGVTPEQADHRYAPDKWSVKEVLVHVIDTERVFAYRALRFSRNDATPLPGFEQDDYVRNSNAGDRSVTELLAEFRAVRMASLALFRGLRPDMLDRRGVASGAELSVRAVPWILAGHEQHHVRILRERYLGGDATHG